MASVISSYTLYIISRVVDEYNWKAVECNRQLVKQFPLIAPKTLFGIQAMLTKRKMITNVGKLKRKQVAVARAVKEEMSKEFETGILEKYGRIHDVPPFAIARIVLENQTRGNKKNVSSCLKNTTLIDDKDLAYEIYLSSIADPYSPLHDCRKHVTGCEHELYLQTILKERGIPFLSEDDLRKGGKNVKTPDILLETPLYYNGLAFSWIESKALFADDWSHRNFFNDQYKHYVNLYGPGMVIYWAGYVDSIAEINADCLLITHKLPEELESIDVSGLCDDIKKWEIELF